jgi:hypothetical protein
LEFKLQLAPILFQPPDKLKLELQLLQSERAYWLEIRRFSNSFGKGISKLATRPGLN